MEISNLPNKQSKVMVIKMFTELRRRMDEHSETLNKELGSIKKEPISTEEYNNPSEKQTRSNQ